MKSLDKGFRHLTRKDKLKKLVEYGWLDDENYEILLNHPLINEEVANSLIEKCHWSRCTTSRVITSNYS